MGKTEAMLDMVVEAPDTDVTIVAANFRVVRDIAARLMEKLEGGHYNPATGTIRRADGRIIRLQIVHDRTDERLKGLRTTLFEDNSVVELSSRPVRRRRI